MVNQAVLLVAAELVVEHPTWGIRVAVDCAQRTVGTSDDPFDTTNEALEPYRPRNVGLYWWTDFSARSTDERILFLCFLAAA